MKKLAYEYSLITDFSDEIRRYSCQCRIFPFANRQQQTAGAEYFVPGGASVWTDGFGNQVINGYSEGPHRSLTVRSKGVVYIDRRMENNPPADDRWPYFQPSELTKPGNEIREFYQKTRESIAGEGRARAEEWMKRVYEYMSYVPGRTTIATSAEEACRLRAGVCQDYAHLLIALLRLDGIAARYAAGFMEGEGATHAWCEAAAEDQWAALDPTHNRLADDSYIKICHGRDFKDCSMDQGRFSGCALQQQSIYVKVYEKM